MSDEASNPGVEDFRPIPYGLVALRDALADDRPVDLTDGELAELAELAAEELVRRLPRYALDQGDIDDKEAVEAREALLDAIVAFREELERGVAS